MIRIDIKERIKRYFFINPTAKLRVRQIERTLQLPLPSVIRYCKELKEEGILQIVTIGNVSFYTANRGVLLEKKLFNIKEIHTSGLLEHLRKAFNNAPILLFGSYANGEDTEESDIDLYIETPSKKKIKLDQFEKLLQRKIQLFQHKNLGSVPNKHLANNIVNGITLNNTVEVFT